LYEIAKLAFFYSTHHVAKNKIEERKFALNFMIINFKESRRIKKDDNDFQLNKAKK